MGSMLSTSRKASYDVLKKQNAETSQAIMDYFKVNLKFAKLSKYEGDLTVRRDEEDAAKLQKGIDFAKEKGVIDPNYVPEPYVEIDVMGKTPDQVAQEIISRVQECAEKEENDGTKKGSIIVLCGLSGTGKGTTVAKLRQILEESDGHKVVTWSNGNIFRSATLLAATWCEQHCDNGEFDAEKALTKDNLAAFMNMLSFDKFDGKYDTRIHGLGLDMLVSNVQNTVLKSPKVSKNIPTVAEFTQGEVILFAAAAVEQMRRDGYYILLEGREQTVNYVRTPHRFTLTLSDDTLIGKRRAAQRIGGAALKELPEDGENDDTAVAKALDKVLEDMVAEIEK